MSPYNFLADPEALEEITKHKWIESEKTGSDVGMEKAAIEWIQRHGKDWLKTHRKEFCEPKKIKVQIHKSAKRPKRYF
ncbi:hypothetical protein B9J78_05120 [bacterium Unc6]|nr:hypothetical protein [bacterium Unc6]